MKKKEISPVEVMKAYLNRIDKYNSNWNAFITINENALQKARIAEDMLMKNKEVGKLHGLPIAIKDLTPTTGIRTTFGSVLFKDYIPNEEPFFLQKIKSEGGIVLGKTNTPEFGHKGITDNLLFGVTKNPWNENCTSGGSSGGSAVAVATNLAPIAEGSDGGGSIRIPAAFTGIFGFKPTYGLVSSDSKNDNKFGSQHPYLHNGPMARNVQDGALLFSVMAGYDINSPSSIPSVADIDKIDNVKPNLKIAYTPNFNLYEVSDDVTQVIEKAVRRFSDLGFSIEEVDIDFGLSAREISRLFTSLWTVRFAATYGELFDRNPDSFPKELGRMIEIGRSIRAVDYKKQEEIRTILWNEVQKTLKEYDILLSPVTAVTAFDHQLNGPSTINDKQVHPARDWMMTQIFNLTGHPAASLPIGLTESKLPVGLQVVGRKFEDYSLLQLCNIYEKHFETYMNPPIIEVDTK